MVAATRNCETTCEENGERQKVRIDLGSAGLVRLRAYCECIGVRRCAETIHQAQVVDAFRDLCLKESVHVSL